MCLPARTRGTVCAVCAYLQGTVCAYLHECRVRAQKLEGGQLAARGGGQCCEGAPQGAGTKQGLHTHRHTHTYTALERSRAYKRQSCVLVSPLVVDGRYSGSSALWCHHKQWQCRRARGSRCNVIMTSEGRLLSPRSQCNMYFCLSLSIGLCLAECILRVLHRLCGARRLAGLSSVAGRAGRHEGDAAPLLFALLFEWCLRQRGLSHRAEDRNESKHCVRDHRERTLPNSLSGKLQQSSSTVKRAAGTEIQPHPGASCICSTVGLRVVLLEEQNRRGPASHTVSHDKPAAAPVTQGCPHFFLSISRCLCFTLNIRRRAGSSAVFLELTSAAITVALPVRRGSMCGLESPPMARCPKRTTMKTFPVKLIYNTTSVPGTVKLMLCAEQYCNTIMCAGNAPA